MNAALQFDTKKFISAKDAARRFGYSNDYIGQLCRAGKIEARMVGRSWFVAEDSITTHSREIKRGGIRVSKAEAVVAKVTAPRSPEAAVFEVRVVSDQPRKDTFSYLSYEADDRPLIPVPDKQAYRPVPSVSDDGSMFPGEIVSPYARSFRFRLDRDLRDRAVAFSVAALFVSGLYFMGYTEKGLSLYARAERRGAEIGATLADLGSVLRDSSSFARVGLGVLEREAEAVIGETAEKIAGAYEGAERAVALVYEEPAILLSAAPRVKDFLTHPVRSTAAIFATSFSDVLSRVKENVGSYFGGFFAEAPGENPIVSKQNVSTETDGAKSDELAADPGTADETDFEEKPVKFPSSSDLIAAAPKQVTQNITYTTTVQGVSSDYLESKLSTLSNAIMSEIYRLSSKADSNTTYINNVYNTVAHTNKIDQLRTVNLYSPTIAGGTIKDATFQNLSGSFNAEITGTSATFSNGLTVNGQLTVTGTATSSLAGDVAFDTNTLYVDSLNNRVGVGTTSPTDTFSVAGPVFLQDVSPSNTSNRLYANATNLYWAGNLIGGATTANWTTDGTHAWRPTGNVGIGTTSPGARLGVAGDILADNITGTRFIATSTTATSTFAGFIDVNGTGTNATSTFASNLWVKGTLQTGTGSIYLTDTSITAGSGAFKLNTSATSTFATNGFTIGTNQFVVQQTSGNVGIGTASPSKTLHIQRSVAGEGLVRLQNDSATGYSTFEIWGSDNAIKGGFGYGNASASYSAGNLYFDAYADFQLIGNNSSNLIFKTSGVNNERMRITSGGNVGIGTTTPSQLLSVHGNSYVSGTSFFGGAITATSTLAVTGNITGAGGIAATIPYASTTAISSTGGAWFATTGGNVGVGTTNPQQKLDIQGTASSTAMYVTDGSSGSPTIAFSGQTTTGFYRAASGAIGVSARLLANDGSATAPAFGFNGDGGVGLYRPTTSQLGFITASAEVMRINASGNVGVGTTSPSQLLSVHGNTLISGNLSVAGITATSSLTVSGSTSLTYASTTAISSTGGAWFATSGGNVGVGTTSPIAAFAVGVNRNSEYGAVISNTGSDNNSQFGLHILAGQNTISDNNYYLRASTGSGTNVGFLKSNTGLFQLRANAGFGLGLGANGTDNYLVINTSGNVGVGTTTPGTELQVQAASGYSEIRISGASGSGGTLEFYNAGTQLADIYANPTKQLIFRTNGATQQMVINESGNVGVGTTSPSQTLAVQGNTLISGNLSVAGITATSTVTLSATSTHTYISNGLGSAGAPSYTFSGDLNTGIWSSGADTINVSTAGSERMRISSAGNASFGTTAAYGHITAVSDQATMAFFSTTNSSGGWLALDTPVNGDSRLIFTEGGTSAFRWTIGNDGNDGDRLKIMASDATLGSGAALTIEQGGNVGVGTTTPTSLLEVTKSQDAGTSVYVTNPNTGTSASAGLVLTNESTGLGGAFGQLVMFGSGYSTSGMRIASSTWLNASGGDLVIGTRTSGRPILFHTGGIASGNERMRIDGTGNVGVGTTTPGAKLAATGDGTTTGRLFALANSSNIERLKVLDNGATTFTPAPSSGNAITITSTGIANNSALLRVDGLSTSGTSYATYSTAEGAATTNVAGYFSAANATNNYALITGAGNVGIGTTGPGTKLQVSGTYSTIAGRYNGIASIYSTNAAAIDAGGTLEFGGTSDTATTPYAFGYIKGAKEALNGTSYAGYLSFWTVSGGAGGESNSAAYERIRINSQGNVGIATTSPGALFAIGNSVTSGGVYVNSSGNLGIGVVSPSYKLEIGNGDALIHSVRVGQGPNPNSTASNGNLVLGNTAGNSLASGSYRNYLIGYGAGSSITTGGDNVILSNAAGSATLANAVIIGTNANGGGSSVVVGNLAGQSSSAEQQVLIGYEAGRSAAGGTGSVAVGRRALINSTGTQNIALGYLAGSSITSGAYNVVIGGNDGSGIATQSNNIILSDGAGNIRMQVNSNGNVGIGTTTPTEELSIFSSGSEARVKISNSINTTSASSTLEFWNNTISQRSMVGYGNGTANGLWLWNYDTSSVILGTSDKERMRIDLNGNVGIGSTSPTALLSLSTGTAQVDGVGTIHVRQTTNTTGSGSNVSLVASNVNGTSQFMQWENKGLRIGTRTLVAGTADIHFTAGNDTEYMTLLGTNGNLGIGTTGPGQKLHIQDATSYTALNVYNFKGSAGGTSAVQFGLHDGTFTTADASRIEARVTSNPNSALDFKVYASGLNTVMTLLGVGNVGIGATSPAAILEINKSSATTYADGNPDENTNIIIANTNTTANNTAGISFNVSAGAGNQAASIESIFKRTNNSAHLVFSTRNDSGVYGERMRIQQDGNLGIGTTGPVRALHVVGGAANTGTALFMGNDARNQIWHSTLTVRQNASDTVVAGSAVSINGEPLASTGSSFYGAAAIKFVRENATANNQDTAIAFWTRAGASDSTTDTEKMRITSGGNVGIGTSNPAAKLSIGNNVYVAPLDAYGDYQLLLYDGGTGAASYGLGVESGHMGFNAGSGYKFYRSGGATPDMVITSGNVGIGTAGPGADLDVAKTTVGYVTGRIQNNDAGASSYALLTVNGYGNSWGMRVGSTAANSNRLDFIEDANSARTPRLSIAVGGNVGIGTTNPGSYKLNVNGSAVQMGDGGSFTLNFNVPNSASVRTNFDSAVGTIMSLQGNGNVGIGTTTPDIKFLVVDTTVGDASGAAIEGRQDGGFGALRLRGRDGSAPDTAQPANQGPGLYFQSYNGSSFGTTGAIVGFTQSALSATDHGGYLSFYTVDDNTTTLDERMRITHDGNVGIGQTAPGDRLSVYLPTTSEGDVISIGNLTNGRFGFIGFDDAATDFMYLSANASDSDQLVIQSGGNVGIGTTSPMSRLAISGPASGASTALTLQRGTSPVYWNFNLDGDNLGFSYNTTSTGQEKLVITTAGNVGVGTTTPYSPNGRTVALSIGTTNAELVLGHEGDTYSLMTSGGAGAGSLDVMYNTTSRLTFTSGGNVGIGVTSPAVKLEVGGEASPGIGIRSSSEVVNNAPQLRFLTGSGTPSNSNQIASVVGVITQADPSSLIGALTFRTNAGDNEDERMRITGAGNVGIGATAPNRKLEVRSDNDTDYSATDSTTWGQQMLIRNNTSGAFNGAGIMYVTEANGEGFFGMVQQADNNNGDFVWATRGSTFAERMRLAAEGNLGIGTTTPNNKLSVVGTSHTLIEVGSSGANTLDRGLRFTDASGAIAGNLIVVPNTVGTNSVMQFYVGGNASGDIKQVITDDGNVGIGDIAPLGKFVIAGNGSNGSGDLRINDSAPLMIMNRNTNPATNDPIADVKFWGNDAGGGTERVYAEINVIASDATSLSADGDIAFKVALDNTIQERMRLAGTGNFGIGTTTPSARLSVRGGGTTTGRAFVIADSSNVEKVTVLDNGNVGIGDVTPDALLDVSNTSLGDNATLVQFEASNASGQLFVQNYTVGADNDRVGLYFQNEGVTNTRLWVDDTGKLRIHNATPTLDDSGTVVGDQTSSLESKNLLGEFTDYTGALSVINSAPLYTFTYKDGSYRGQEFVGIITDYSPVFGKDKDEEHPAGKALNEITGLGYTFAAIKELSGRTAGILSESTTTPTTLYIDSSGNIGIGTTSPEYKLHVMGDVAATSFVNISTKTAKKDIEYYDEAEKASVLEKMKNVGIATYNYIGECADDPATRSNLEQGSTLDCPKRLGLIAEEAPSEVLSANGKGVDVYKLSTFILAGVQEQQREIEAMDLRLKEVEDLIASGGAGGSFLDILASFGVRIANGLAEFKNVIVASLTVGSDQSPAGVTLYDKATKQPYCFYMENGAPKTAAGACSETSETDGSSGETAGTPVFTMNGNNPATIDLNASYTDLGVRVVDPATSQELGYRTFLNGTEVGTLTLDTATSTTYTIEYVATTQAGVTATTTRSVIVGDASTTTGGTEPSQSTSPASEPTASSTPQTTETETAGGGTASSTPSAATASEPATTGTGGAPANETANTSGEQASAETTRSNLVQGSTL